MQDFVMRAAFLAVVAAGIGSASALAAEKKLVPAPLEPAKTSFEMTTALTPDVSDVLPFPVPSMRRAEAAPPAVETMRKLRRSDRLVVETATADPASTRLRVVAAR
jgi:hypothetical protein